MTDVADLATRLRSTSPLLGGTRLVCVDGAPRPPAAEFARSE